MSTKAAQTLALQLPEAPWVRVRQVQLIRREIREVLSPSALEVLWRHGEHVIEAGRELSHGRGAAGKRFYATVMVTFDLRRGAGSFREPADVATAERLAELMLGNPRVQKKLVALARPELAKLAQMPEACLYIEMDFHVRAEGTRILLDGDAMVSLESARKAGTYE